MELYVLNKEFEILTVVDGYESLIWTERYFDIGDFEIYTPLSTSFLEFAQPGYYLWNSDSDRLMIIERFNTITDAENGIHISITGRSLESILERRIVWEKKVFTDVDPVEIIFSVLDSEIEKPSEPNRKIVNFKHLDAPVNLPEREKISIEFLGETVYEIVQLLCESCSIGFKVILENGVFIFSLYYGENRSFDQDNNPWIIFSSDYDNITDTSYSEDNTTYRNSILAKIDEDYETGDITTVNYSLDDAIGLNRKELYYEVTDIDKDEAGEEYEALALQRAKTELEFYIVTKEFEGNVETHISFEFNVDYTIGDIVQIVTPIGRREKARITEVVRSFSESGIDIIPSFSII